MNSKSQRSSGFTKWELLVVLGVIGLLSIIAIPSYQNFVMPLKENIDPMIPVPKTGESALGELSWGSAAFNNPGTVGFGQTAVVQLLLSGTMPQEALQKQIEEDGVVKAHQVRFADEMEANLVGSAFDISPITKERQVVNADGVTEWKWEVRGKSLGEYRLFLTLNAHVIVDGHGMQHTVETLNEVMRVKIVWPESAIYFLTVYWQFVLTALVIPPIGWAASRMLRNR